MQELRAPLLKTQAFKVPPFEPKVGQNLASDALPVARKSQALHRFCRYWLDKAV